MFFCVPGAKVDGHDLAWEALERGAAALVVERELDVRSPAAHRPRQPGRDGRRRGRLLRRADEGARGRGRDGDEREDDDGLPAARDARGDREEGRPGRHGRMEDRRCETPGAVHDPGGNRPPAALPRDARRRRPRASRSRRLRTGRCSGGSIASGSMRSSSRTCRRTTSTCTGRWRTTSSRRGRSSRARCHRLRRSTSTTSGARAWRSLLRICIELRSSPSASATAPRSGPRSSS